jgi:hypothetical protein
MTYQMTTPLRAPVKKVAYLDDARIRKLKAEGKRVCHKPRELELFNPRTPPEAA